MSNPVGRPPQPFGRYKIMRLYGIKKGRAWVYRLSCERLRFMKPEARRFTVKMILGRSA